MMEHQDQLSTKPPYKKKVLIADDSQVSLASLEKLFSTSLFHTIRASNGKEAFEKAICELPDLILLDVIMPEMNGFDAARILKEDTRTHSIPIIMVTALDDPEYENAGRGAGAEEYLAKPVRPQELITRANSLIALRQYRDQLSLRNHSQWSFLVDKHSDDAGPEPDKQQPLVLLVEDNESDAELVRHCLKDLPLKFERLSNGEEAVEICQTGNVGLLLLDILLPGLNGFEVCRQVKHSEKGKDLPIVVITCLEDMDSRLKCIELQTDDYLVKPIVSRELQARVKILLEKKQQLDKLRAHYERALNSAVVDWLTGLYNQGYFKKFLDLEIKKSLRQRYPVTLIMMDIDDFKAVNDAYGHPTGDLMLQELAQVVRKSVREVDLVARYGGDEFAVVLPYSDGYSSIRVAHRIDEAIKTHGFSQKVSTEKARLTVSMGVAGYPEDAVHVDELIHSADQKLYSAKTRGKNQISS